MSDLNIPEPEQIFNNTEEISLKEIVLKLNSAFKYLLTNWILILIAGTVGGFIGLMYAYLKKPIYKAELSFALQDEQSNGGFSSALGLASQFGIDLTGSRAGGEFSGDNLLELMKSRVMIEKALLTSVTIGGKKETLAELFIDFNNLRKNWEGDSSLEKVRFAPAADPSKFTLAQDSLLGVFHKTIITNYLSVDKIDKKLSIIYLRVNSKSELFSKYFTEALTKVVSDFYIQTKTKKGKQNVALLQRQTDSIRHALNYAILGVASSIDATPNSNPLLQTLRVPSQKRQIDVQANTSILSELVKNLEITKMALLQETPLIQIIDLPILPLEKTKVSRSVGLIVGLISSMFLVSILLLFKKSFKKIMN